jgi:hypothetical protein
MKTMKKMMTLLAVAGMVLALAGSAQAAAIDLVSAKFTGGGQVTTPDYPSDATGDHIGNNTLVGTVTWDLGGFDVTHDLQVYVNGNWTVEGGGSLTIEGNTGRLGKAAAALMTISEGSIVSYNVGASADAIYQQGNAATIHLDGIGSTIIVKNVYEIANFRFVGDVEGNTGTSDEIPNYIDVTVSGGTLSASTAGGFTTVTVAGPAGTVIMFK